MSTSEPTKAAKMILEIDSKIQAEVEEMCLNKDMTIGQYFSFLHNDYYKTLNEPSFPKEEETKDYFKSKKSKK